MSACTNRYTKCYINPDLTYYFFNSFVSKFQPALQIYFLFRNICIPEFSFIHPLFDPFLQV